MDYNNEIAIIGKAPNFVKVIKRVVKAAETQAPVLITGESGTGKEILAAAIHYLSERKNKTFIKVNCAAIQDTLLESELFGHEKGAFTGAIKTKIGKFQQAYGGSILLDEIGDMTPTLQSKVLRAIENKEFERVGGNETIHTDARIISSTNADLIDGIDKKKFRLDLYHRLSVVKIHIPPLRERKIDIPILAYYFLDKISEEYEKNITGIDDEVLELLTKYFWPGNVRELKNVIETAILFCDDDSISMSYVDIYSEKTNTPTNNESVRKMVSTLLHYLKGSKPNTPEAMSKLLYEQALIECNGVQKDAAELIGVSRRVATYWTGKMNLSHLIPRSHKCNLEKKELQESKKPGKLRVVK